jgi:hypothetical protein
VGETSFAVGDQVNVRDANGGLVYAKPAPIIRFERYEDGFYYAVLDTEEMPRYHRIETLMTVAEEKTAEGTWVGDLEDFTLAYDDPPQRDNDLGEFGDE